MGKKKTSKQKLAKEADDLWQEIMQMGGGCEGHLSEGCDNYGVVGHHIIYKSQSNRLRYELKNGIRLCRKCHYYAHRYPNIAANKITKVIGQDRMDWLESVRRDHVYTNSAFYEKALENLAKGE